MNTAHAKALYSFARELHWLLTLRLGVQLLTVWFFVWGVVVLALRIFGTQNTFWFMLGLGGIVPLMIYAAWQARKQKSRLFAKIRASYDRLNVCGGLIMAEETANMDARGGRNCPEHPCRKFPLAERAGVAVVVRFGIVFVMTALLLPERMTHLGGRHHARNRADGRTASGRSTDPGPGKEFSTRRNPMICSGSWSRMQTDSSGYDPDKTWEALDHIKQAKW